jgi:transcriptional regulator with XRE-family HTH domain
MTEQKKLEIASRLRELYEASDETYLSIAEALDVRERTVASWLSPTSPMPISYKSGKKYADLFNVSIDWLWRGEEDLRVPANFMERFAALEEEVKALRTGAARELEKDLDEAVRRSGSSAKRTSKSRRASRKKS